MALKLLSASFWLFVCCLVNESATEQQVIKELSDEDIFLRNKYKEMDTSLKLLITKTYKSLLPHLLEVSEAMNLSRPCLGNILNIGSGLHNLNLWAMQFLDATGKINDGLMYGNIQMLGNYDQCLSATARKKNGEVDFRGRYCLISYKPFLPNQESSNPRTLLARTYANTRNLSEILQYAISTLHKGRIISNYYGLCVPSGCGLKDVENMMKYVRDLSYMNITVKHCQVQDEVSYFDTKKIIIICIFGCFGLLGIISSAMEHYYKSKKIEMKGMTAEVLRCFSITSNFKRMISTKTETDQLSYLNGIRVLSMFYVIYIHKFTNLQNLPLRGNFQLNMMDYTSTFFYQIVTNGGIILEVFFFMSGFLQMYLRMKLDAKKKTINWLVILIHRLWRLYPGYICIILLSYLFTPRGPIGPYFNQHFIEGCSGEWWKNLLFINNFYPKNKCFLHTWYIACDMQLFLISLIAMQVTVKQRKFGILLNTAIVLLSMISTALWIYMNEIAPTFLPNLEIPGGKYEVVRPYFAPTTHAPSYFLGMLIGYFLSTRTNIKIPKVYQVTGWIAASFLFTSMLFMTHRWNSGTPYTPLESGLYFACSRPLYALAIGWMICCCITGHGGIINYILSLKLWIPLSRLTFTIYLVSQPIQIFYLANLKTPGDTQWMIWIWEYLGDICVSSLLALVIAVLVEKPIIGMEKLVFPNRNQEKEQTDFEKMAVIKECKNGFEIANSNGTISSWNHSDVPTETNGKELNHALRRRSSVVEKCGEKVVT